MKKKTIGYTVETTAEGEIKISQPTMGKGIMSITILHEQVSTMVNLIQWAKDEIVKGQECRK